MGLCLSRGLGALFVCVVACGGGTSQVTTGADASQADGGFTASSLIGPLGGIVTLGEASITIPPGALPVSTRISITQQLGFPPSQYVAYSPFYQFAPSGLTFATPATVVMPRNGGPSSLAMYWSKAGANGYERLASIVTAHSASAQVMHFSGGFLGIPAGVDADGGGDSGFDATSGGHDAASDATSGGHDSGPDVASGDGSAAVDAHDAGPAPDAGSEGGGSTHDAAADAPATPDTGTVGCMIGGAPYATGAPQPGQPCETCQPSKTTTAFYPLPNGTSCAAHETCQGGVCTDCYPICAEGVECAGDDECASDVCTAGACAPPACSPNCAESSPCGASSDCTSDNCIEGECDHPSCAPSCTQGERCDTAANCASQVCTNNTCAAPACSPSCAVGAACGASTDCTSGTCTAGECATCTTQVDGCVALWQAEHEMSTYYTDYSTCDAKPGSSAEGPYCITAPGGGGGYCCCNPNFNPGACPAN